MKKSKFINNVPDIKDKNGLWLKTYSENTETLYICRKTRSCVLWNSINDRVSNTTITSRNNPTYEESRNMFHDFQSFAEWCNSQYGYTQKDKNGRTWEIDKDILSFGKCKDYSEDNCIFVPKSINTILTLRASERGQYPLGVHLHKCGDLYVSQCGPKYLGCFKNAHDAHRAWQTEKSNTFLRLSKDVSLGERLQSALLNIALIIELDFNYNKETTY